MKIDKEGFKIIRNTFLISLVVVGISFFTLCKTATISIAAFMFLLCCFVIRFFRIPKREYIKDKSALLSPADGTIVAIEKVVEDEYFKDERIQVSIFMSVWNVHANWFPIAGEVKYFRHHHGDFLMANHPKSSTENERTTTVVTNEKIEILFRQVAGYVARRIVSYAIEGSVVEQNSRCGFIKFGSRVDIFLPLGTEINVKLGDKVVGTETKIAQIK